MRTLTALALATAMLFTAVGAQATTHKKKHHSSSTTKPKPEAKTTDKK